MDNPETNGVEKEVSTDRVINITLKEDGSLSVHGAINDRVIAYGMLEFARDAIFDHHLKLALKGATKNRIFPFTRGH